MDFNMDLVMQAKDSFQMKTAHHNSGESSWVLVYS